MKTAHKYLCLGIGILALTLNLQTQAAPQYDSLVLYFGPTPVYQLTAVTPGAFYFVNQVGLANPQIIQAVVLHDPAADTSAPFMADVFGVATFPTQDDPQGTTPYIFLISDTLWDPVAQPGGTLVPDTQDIYDATGFLNPAVAAQGITLFFEQGVKVPDAGSTLLLLLLGLGGVAASLRRK
jgi:hypothetical protein